MKLKIILLIFLSLRLNTDKAWLTENPGEDVEKEVAIPHSDWYECSSDEVFLGKELPIIVNLR